MRGIVILQQLSIDVKRSKDVCEVQDNPLIQVVIVRTIFCWRRFRDIGLYVCDCDSLAAWFAEMFNTFNTAVSSWGTSKNCGLCCRSHGALLWIAWLLWF